MPEEVCKISRVIWDYEKVKEFTEQHSNAILISDNYVDRFTPMRFKCHCENEFERSWKVFLRGSHECKKCAWDKVNVNRKYTIELIDKFVKENSSSVLLSKEYKNVKEKLKFKCECGRVFETPFDNFKNSNKRQCNHCSIEHQVLGTDYQLRPKTPPKSNEQFLKDLENSRGKEFVPLESYTSAKIPIEVKHIKCNNIWEVSPDHLINRKDNCPYCTDNHLNSRGALKIQGWLRDNEIAFTREKTFEGLTGIDGKTRLRFDFYLTELNLCIEFDGEQHFNEKLSDYKLTTLYDKKKDEYCKKHSIKLIRIPYYDINSVDHLLNMSIPSQACAETAGRCRD